ncbi:hypothetical protein Goshw_025882 [Gossypium schwendimanii]|uniref:Transcription repressor n=2 Tax=Gossypium TaxID=3633 RepID=A0A0D2USI1_GOSRA|nr:transcription repressor OFP2 [Gossypium raimondii]KJB71554.1 hypothetical protein B456_011G129100 [Gossypium raimondii]MBA0599685.1 hypothetical protein [Gossypium raimondii]MBA0879279.1 hypothetical protein [Gossypium schwendimanii]
MGNYRFRLSDMMPNAWFYKLKDMGKGRNHGNTTITNNPSKKKQYPISPSSSKLKQPHHFYPRKSYYFTRDLIPSDGFYVSHANTKSAGSDPPRKSSQKRSRKRNTVVSSGCRCRATLWTKPDSPPQYSASSSSDDSSSPHEFRSDCILTTQSFDNMVSSSCKLMNSEAKDDDCKCLVKKSDKLDELDNLSQLQLPRIITKPVNMKKSNEATKYGMSSVKFEGDENKKSSGGRKFGVNSPGVRLRINSPKIGNRRIQGHGRKSMSSSSSGSSRRSLLDSLAVVKSSFDPQRDFRESMVEMIIENNIRASKDLEDLLACYLSLNSDQYHHLIIKVFKQIWFDMNDVRLK